MSIDRDRLVESASRMIATPSFTGDEQAMGELMAETFGAMGLQVQWQQVEDGRANVLGTWPGDGGGPSLMFNGHMDTSYSGREPWLAGVRGFQPTAFVKDGRLFGLGISNMKGALACYVEAVRALQDAGVRLRGDLLVAAVCGEIEMEELAPVAEAMEHGGRLAAKEQVSDSLLDRCKPIAGTPDECIAAMQEYRDAGCTHVMLELWGADRHEQIRLFGEQVLPRVRA